MREKIHQESIVKELRKEIAEKVNELEFIKESRVIVKKSTKLITEH